MPQNIISLIFLIVGLLAGVSYTVRFLRSRYGAIKTVEAVVIHKQTVEHFSKYSSTGKHTKFSVTFLANGKKLSFYVSEFSYGGYRLNESGTLKYRGDRLLDFS